VAISERVDAAANAIANIRLGEASWEISPLGVQAALFDVTSKARNPAESVEMVPTHLRRDVYERIATAALEHCVTEGWATVREEDGERVYSLDKRGQDFIHLHDPEGEETGE
jgi:hypothetical protein